jgi:hypothetical protein
MGVKRVVVQIDRLALTGMSAADGVRLRSGLQAELRRLLGMRSTGRRLANLRDAAAIRVDAAMGGHTARSGAGARVAQAIYKGLLR